MSHLDAETLARLVDDPPAPLEAAHLAGCDACRAELDAMRADVRALAELGPVEPPANAWDALHVRLVDEGLVRAAQRRTGPALLRIAAALTLFLAGTAAGFTWRDSTLAPQVAAVPTDLADTPGTGDRATATDASPTADMAVQTDEPAARTGTAAGSQTAGTPDPSQPAVGLASHPAAAAGDVPAADTRRDDVRGDDVPRGEPRITGPLRADPRFAMQPYDARNAQEAAMALRDAEGLYLDALAQFAQLAGGRSGEEDPVARLVALESIVLSTREALDRAPADPIINGYHMTAVAQRDATLRQIAAQSRDPWF